MIMDWQDYMKQLSPQLRELRLGTPDVMKNFSGMAQAALKTNALDTKTKELIALAIGVATRCDDCIAFHEGGLRAGRFARGSHGDAGPRHLHGRRAVRHVRKPCGGSV